MIFKNTQVNAVDVKTIRLHDTKITIEINDADGFRTPALSENYNLSSEAEFRFNSLVETLSKQGLVRTSSNVYIGSKAVNNVEHHANKLAILFHDGTQLNIFGTQEDLLLIEAGQQTGSGGGGGEGDTFTNLNPSVIEVGGIDQGSTFIEATLSDLFNQMLYPELNPTLTGPTHSISDNMPNLVEVGSTHTIILTSNFNRGTISPAYGTSGYRSGSAIEYLYTGNNVPTTAANTSNRDVQQPTIYFDTARTETWTSRVRYSAGEQPKTSKGNDYNSPLPTGVTTAKSTSVKSVYAYYATTANITTMTKQSLTDGTYFEVEVIGEDDDGNKQTIDYVKTLKAVSGIEFYNTAAGNKWEWLGGSRANSISQFEESTVDYDGVEYRRYVNTSSKVGGRLLRFYTN